MAKSFCSLLINAKHAIVANFNVANMSFNAIREHKILAAEYFRIYSTFKRYH